MSRSKKNGFSLIEAVFVITLLGIIVSIGVPVFRNALEHSRVDLAAANLHAVHSAQRVYWLEKRTYAPSMKELESWDLVEASLAKPKSQSKPFYYEVASADASSFQATAARVGSTVWSGQLSIDESGILKGTISGNGFKVVPGFE